MSDIEKYIGNTPLVLIDEVGTNQIYGKLEGNNPAGSIKDRPAIRMIKDAERSGLIKKGDTLISFDCKLYNAQLEVIKADHKSAQVQLKNDKELLDMRSIGELQYQLSESALKKAEAELTIAKLNVERCNIIAPYDGRVMDVYTNVFTSIEQRQPLMDIVGDGLLEAAVVVPSKWLSWLKKGHDVKIIIDETGDELNAKIISLGAAVDAASQTIELKAQFNEKYESLIPGMSGIVKF